MATQQVNAAKLKSTGVNLTNLAAKMKSEMNKLDENKYLLYGAGKQVLRI